MSDREMAARMCWLAAQWDTEYLLSGSSIALRRSMAAMREALRLDRRAAS